MKIEVDMDFITENDLFHVAYADQKCQVPEMQNLGMVLMTENYTFECTKDMHKEGVYVLKWYYDIYIWRVFAQPWSLKHPPFIYVGFFSGASLKLSLTVL